MFFYVALKRTWKIGHYIANINNDNDNECFILTYELIKQIIYSTMIDQYSHSQGNYIMTYISLACNYRKIFF